MHVFVKVTKQLNKKPAKGNSYISSINQLHVAEYFSKAGNSVDKKKSTVYVSRRITITFAGARYQTLS
jgi:hypothetical protein